MRDDQIRNYIDRNRKIWEKNGFTVDDIAKRCLVDGEELGIDRYNSTVQLLLTLQERGVIKSWYHNNDNTYYVETTETKILQDQIEKMKCCENCKHHRFMGNELDCKIGWCEKEEKWELFELK